MGVDVADCEAKHHAVVHKTSGKSLGCGELAEAAAALPTPPAEELRLKKESEFRYIGKGTVTIVDLHDTTTGNTTYGQDVKLPGMHFAGIARSPVVQGRVASFDASATMKVPGVEKVVTIDGTPSPAKYAPLAGVAVIAKNTWAAIKGREALKIVWDDGPNKSHDSAAYKTGLEAAVRKTGKVERNQGDADKALGSAAKVITADYYVHETLLGGGFGRKSKCDFAIEAALLSKAMGGAPVKVVWTREDDIQHGF